MRIYGDQYHTFSNIADRTVHHQLEDRSEITKIRNFCIPIPTKKLVVS